MPYNFESEKISLIAEAFDESGIEYIPRSISEADALLVSYSANGLPELPDIRAMFVCGHAFDTVQFFVSGLIESIPEEKRAHMLEACNAINNECSFFRFVIDDDGDLNASYDIPQYCSDDCIGLVACELIQRLQELLQNFYPLLLKTFFA